jgi:hypothetical protein
MTLPFIYVLFACWTESGNSSLGKELLVFVIYWPLRIRVHLRPPLHAALRLA